VTRQRSRQPSLHPAASTAASLVILGRYLRSDAWSESWYAWMLVGCATAVSVALNVAHAPDGTSPQLFAALPWVALLGVGAADERGPHRAGAPGPHDRRGGSQR
jgi:hypothetical protein